MSKELIELNKRMKKQIIGDDESEITKLREQVAAQAAVIEKLRDALAYCASDLRPEMQSRQVVATNALAIPTDSTQILDEVRRAERERCAEWQPIETAPKNGAWALVYADGAVDCAFVQYGKTPDDWTKPTCPNVQPEYVTHWMPLPNAPKQSERWSESWDNQTTT